MILKFAAPANLLTLTTYVAFAVFVPSLGLLSIFPVFMACTGFEVESLAYDLYVCD